MLAWLESRTAALLNESTRPHIVHLPTEHVFAPCSESSKQPELIRQRVALMSYCYACVKERILVKLKDVGLFCPT